MKIRFKKIISIIMVFAMAVGTFTFSHDARADTTAQDWKANAVITPAEGSLIGAGYIDVIFDNSMPGYTYEVLLDGNSYYWKDGNIVKTDIGEVPDADSKIKTFSSDDTPKTEVYTTSVAKHEITIKATKDSETITSDKRVFYVSKKGMAMGDNMGDKVSLKKLNCSWYYNWSPKAFNNSIDTGVQHIPMMWGGSADDVENMKNVNLNSNYFLGFNEPDIDSQANMYFFDAIDVWKQYISPLHMRNVSPAPAAPGGDSGWLKQFMTGDYKCKSRWDDSWGLYSEYLDDNTKTWVAGIPEEVDSVCLHYYRSEINLDGLKRAVKTLWDEYHKPIWITEISIFGMKGSANIDFSYEIPERRAQMAAYVKGIVEALDAIPYVERYCWFAYDIDSTNEIDGWNGSGATAMFEYASGLYTDLGKLYSSIGNPEGYAVETISDDETFIFQGEEQTTEKITTEPVTEKVITTEPFTEKITQSSGIQLATTKITSAKKKKSAGKVKVVFKKVAGAKKYQIQFSTTKKFKKVLVNKTVKSTSPTIKNAKFKNLKKLFVRVKAIGAKKWSKVFKVNITK